MKDEKVREIISKNSFKIDNFELSKNIDQNGGYYLIKSEKASFSKSMKKIEMNQCDIIYNSDNNSLNFSAEICIYMIDKEVVMHNNIEGNYKDIMFNSGKDGQLYYDVVTDNGSLLGGIMAKQGPNQIMSDRVYIDRKNQMVRFVDSVEVTYALD